MMIQEEVPMTEIPACNVTIYVGLKERNSGEEMLYEVAESFIQGWVDALGMCVTFTRTKFIYTRGNENGLIIGFINYPRFPSSPEVIESNALWLAEELMVFLKQFRVTVVTPTKSIMLSNPLCEID